MRFSVIVPSYKAQETILKCLTGLKEQLFQDFEVIVIDSSPDSAVKDFVEKYSSYKIIHLKEKTLSEVTRNMAADKAIGDILVFLDADCIPHKDWLLQADAAFRNGAKAISGPVLCFGNKFLDMTAHLSKFWLWLPDKNKKHVETAPTANFAVFREIFNTIGGLNPAHLASADSSFCYKLADSGIEIQFINAFVVEHLHDTSFKSLCVERFKRGREFGIMRTQLETWTKRKSLLFMLSILFLPAKNLILKLLAVSKSGYFYPFMKAFFSHLILEHAWMYGQLESHINHILKDRRDS